MRLNECEQRTREYLKKAGVDNPGLCSRLLVAHVAGLDKISYILAYKEELNKAQVALLSDLTLRVSSGEPIAYIIGEREFYGRPFLVNSHTLIPRPETELLIDIAITKLDKEQIIFCDAGTGSGCIGVTLMHIRQTWRGLLLEKNMETLKVARINAQRMKINAEFILGDMFKMPFGPESLDLIIGNPPYISPGERGHVMKSVLAYEPHYALFSKKEGRAHLEALISGAKSSLKHGGCIILEHGYKQGDWARSALLANGFHKIEVFADLAGKPRCTFGIKK